MINNRLMEKIYFPNLNGLRFIAALAVLVRHIEEIKGIFGMQQIIKSSNFDIGKLGVILFFVLSGFLITYLLMFEEDQTKTISVKDFYVRRILRIWPLYYLIVVLSFFAIPNIDFFSLGNPSYMLVSHVGFKLILFIFFLPNLALAAFAPVPYGAHSWSVGVEEQFYLVWPLLIRKIKNRETLLYSVILIYLFIKLVGFPLVERYITWKIGLGVLRAFWNSFSIDCMAIGGIFALYLYRKDRILNFLFNKVIQWSIFTLLCLLLFFNISIPYIHYDVYAILFGVLIVNCAANKNSIINLENRPLKYLGKISYGFYMLHPVAIVIALKVLQKQNIDNIVLQYLLSFTLTFLLAAVSYELYEKYFILKKIKFSKIITGENVNSNYVNP